MAFSLNRFLLFEKPPEEKLTAQQQLQPKIPPKITVRNLECRDDDSNFSVSAPSTQHMNETHSHCLVAAWLFFYIHRRWWQQHFSCVVFVANGNCQCACICYVPNVIKLPLPTKQLSFGLIFLSCSFARSQNKNDGSCFGAVLIPFRKSWGLNAVDTFWGWWWFVDFRPFGNEYYQRNTLFPEMPTMKKPWPMKFTFTVATSHLFPCNHTPTNK